MNLATFLHGLFDKYLKTIHGYFKQDTGKKFYSQPKCDGYVFEMTTSEDKWVGRRLRSGFKPNFRPDFKPNDRPNRGLTKNGPKDTKVRLKIERSVINDRKLFLNQTIQLVRLRAHVIRRYDKKFYIKYSKRLKAEQNLIKYSKIRQILARNQFKPKPTTNDSPKRMLLWTSPKPKKQSTGYPILRSHVKRLAKCDDRENSLISLPEFCRNLNLISFNDMNRMNTKQMNTTLSIRHIAKCEDYTVNQNNQIEINYEYLIEGLNTNENPNSIHRIHRKKKNRRNVWTVNKVKQKYSKLEQQKQKMAELWKKRYIKCMSMYEMSSPMGQRVYTSLKAQKLEPKKVQSYVKRYESFCGTRIRFKNKDENELNKWTAGKIERLTTGQELSQRNRCLPSHQYSFTRRQRLDKMLRTKTGIDWKSRLLALNCSPKSEVRIKKIMFCPICRQHIENNHSCDISASISDHRSDSSDGLKPSILKSPTISADSSRRVLRHQNRIIEDNVVEKKASPKKKVSFTRSGPRICFIDLDQI